MVSFITALSTITNSYGMDCINARQALY